MFLLTGFVKITWRFTGRMVNRWLFTHNKVRRQCGSKIVCELLTTVLKFSKHTHCIRMAIYCCQEVQAYKYCL